ncbi:hypothetical protein LJB71_08290 [Thermomonas sp. S9]|uniref:hypothetical protein n=1 Tax=Thermomonas sp. S9 TaxID=2885203 RepID=UPI00216AE8CC|nr:hypothetical protein [Thermomonas sp. S9]MCR6496214.1 hypothetical protein [Thermomonas sp. S9]
MPQPKFWANLKAFSRKLVPSRAARWTLLYVPAFTAVLLLALRVIGGLDDLVAYVMEVGTRSLPVLIGVALTYGLATGLQWNLDNTERARLQRIVAGEEEGSQWGAFSILAGEMLSILALLVLILRALLVWQG